VISHGLLVAKIHKKGKPIVSAITSSTLPDVESLYPIWLEKVEGEFKKC
jgi:hypothetical protein